MAAGSSTYESVALKRASCMPRVWSGGSGAMMVDGDFAARTIFLRLAPSRVADHEFVQRDSRQGTEALPEPFQECFGGLAERG